MPHFSKDGSVPQPQTDGTNGWFLVPDPPTDIPEGKELTWLNWEWVIRDPRPANLEGHVAKWNHDDRVWIQHRVAADVAPETIRLDASTAAISLNFASAAASAGTIL